MQAKTITIRGKNYKQVPEREEGKCAGCAFFGDLHGCSTAAKLYDCYSNYIIWASADNTNTSETTEEPKFTLQEFVEIISNAGGYISTDVLSEAAKQFDPEYKEYTRLKKKFE